ncbi:MAG: hypothetical protein LBQ54_03750 [Planctomycetaceae bacterium]|nr:hypothetical protein [Planctomycetaceae bacterium]
MKRQPVSDAVVDTVIPYLPRVVAAMVTETGMRPGELFRFSCPRAIFRRLISACFSWRVRAI